MYVGTSNSYWRSPRVWHDRSNGCYCFFSFTLSGSRNCGETIDGNHVAEFQWDDDEVPDFEVTAEDVQRMFACPAFEEYRRRRLTGMPGRTETGPMPVAPREKPIAGTASSVRRVRNLETSRRTRVMRRQQAVENAICVDYLRINIEVMLAVRRAVLVFMWQRHQLQAHARRRPDADHHPGPYGTYCYVCTRIIPNPTWHVSGMRGRESEWYENCPGMSRMSLERIRLWNESYVYVFLDTDFLVAKIIFNNNIYVKIFVMQMRCF